MGVGWLIVMNVLQPRLMQEAVGIHPIVVLGSVLIGCKIAGVTGAIFGIPIAAVISAFFFHFLVVTREPSPVATRAGEAGRGAGGPAGPGSRASRRRESTRTSPHERRRTPAGRAAPTADATPRPRASSRT